MGTSSTNVFSPSRWSISIIFFCYGLTFASWAARIPTIQTKFQLSEAGLGTLLIALPVGSFISLPIAGYLAAKYGSKLVTIASIIAYSTSFVSIAFFDSIYLIGIMLFFLGFMGNSVNIAINTQAVDLGKLMKKTIMASFHGVWSLAGFAGAAIGALFIANDIGLQVHYISIFILNITLSLLAFPNLLQQNKDKQSTSDEPSPIFVLPDKSLLLLGIIAFFSMLIEGTMFDWSGVYFKKVVESPLKWVGVGYVAFMISMAGVRFVADKLTNMYGAKRMIFISGICSFSGLLLVIAIPQFVVAVVGFFIIGLGVSVVIPLVFDMAGNSKKMLPSLALASVSTMGFFGFLIGPPIIGFIAEALGLRTSFSLIAFMALLVVILSRRLKKRQAAT